MAHESPESGHRTPLPIDGGPLTVVDVEQVARQGRRVELSPAALERISQSRKFLESTIGHGRPIYGVNTGFGSFATKTIPPNKLGEVQKNLIRSHSTGVSDALPVETVRAMLFILAGSLSRGHSGVRPKLVHAIVDLLNAGITPVVPSVGSVGASGDLAPLAHAMLAVLGEGEVIVGGERTDAAKALKKAKLDAMDLTAKEGLALINGTHLMCAQAALLMADIERVFDAATIAACMSIEGCLATDAFLDARVYRARNHSGPARVAARMRTALADSGITKSHSVDDPRVQDPYSLRCVAPVLGAALDAIENFRRSLLRELGAVTDNPLVFPPDGTDVRNIISAGNFHGMPIALPLDQVCIAIAHVAGIAERRVYLMLSGNDTYTGVPAHLSPEPGLQSGLMIAQYTAAACCNEIATLCTPASVTNIPTSAGVEDYNSYGPRSAAKARRAIELARYVVAIEMLCAAEAMEYHRPLKSGDGVERAHALVRSVVPKLSEDRATAHDIDAIVALIDEGRFG
ncbi:hutH [Symbiodinium necroappetens]|uniref:Histidine ammonia-lyase n=1 Tax=Symbiodinium necroappetens TaxID=1628268 RepID=A0A812WCX5_9DINO|nr:hutH [Symbiodinium necroappetens]